MNSAYPYWASIVHYCTLVGWVGETWAVDDGSVGFSAQDPKLLIYFYLKVLRFFQSCKISYISPSCPLRGGQKNKGLKEIPSPPKMGGFSGFFFTL